MENINNALLHIKAKHNGEIPYQYGSRECAKLMDSYAKEYHKRKLKLLGISDVSDILPDEVPNLFVTLAQQIHHESVINGLDMTNIIECFNELQEAYKKERSITHCT